MTSALIFRPSFGSVVSSALFFVACVVVVVLCGLGISAAKGQDFMLLAVMTVFPALMSATAALRLAAVGSRRILLEEGHLVHRQVFKNHTVPYREIARIEARQKQDGEVDTVKILWSGTPFYIDEKAISDFPSFISALRRRLPGVEMVFVTEFSATN